MKHAIK